MDILKTLTENHRELKSLLKRLDATTERSAKTREKLFKEFKAKLVAHAKSEEAVLYDRLRQEKGDVRDQTLESYEEHHVADMLLKELTALSTDNERWGAKMAVLKESLEHHIEEEEKELFVMARKKIEREELVEMNEEFINLREAHLSGLGAPMRLLKKAQTRLAS